MLILGRRILLLCSLLLFSLHSVAAGDGPKRALQGIKAITYFQTEEIMKKLVNDWAASQ